MDLYPMLLYDPNGWSPHPLENYPPLLPYSIYSKKNIKQYTKICRKQNIKKLQNCIYFYIIKTTY